MKILAMVTMAAIVAATAFAEEALPPRERKVTICMDASANGVEIGAAQVLASKMFASIDVGVDWRPLRSCPVGGNALQVSVSYNTPEHQLPDAVAYALPYEGSHIVVFYDRVRKSNPNRTTCLLAYVLVHE